MTATQSGRSTVPRVLIHPPGCQPTRTGRTLLAGFGWFCRLLPRTGLANSTEEPAGWRNVLLTASRFCTVQEEQREGHDRETASSDGRLGFGYKDRTVPQPLRRHARFRHKC